MSDIRKIGFLGCAFLVVLRVSIGWQLLYEGLWKLETQGTANRWTAEPYLKNAQGPWRDHFRNLTGDPNDLKWLDYETVTERWDAWQQDFATHYQLDEKQQKALNDLVNGPEEFSTELAQLPDGYELPRGRIPKGDGVTWEEVIRWTPDEGGKLIISGKYHLTPDERSRLMSEANRLPGSRERDLYRRALDGLYKEAKSKLSYKERLAAQLRGDPENVTIVNDTQVVEVDGEVIETSDYKRIGKIEQLKDLVERYEAKAAQADQDFEYEHLAYERKQLQQKKDELIGPVKSLQNDLWRDASQLLTDEQRALGALSLPIDDMRLIDLTTMWGLTIIGCLLIGGLLTRLAALAGAVMIFNFYMAYPPLPGYPPPPGVEHAFIINKNLIEVLALLAFVFLPSGRWFGVDALIAGLLGFGSSDKKSD